MTSIGMIQLIRQSEICGFDFVKSSNSNHRWLLCSISLKGHSITRGRRCASIVIRAHIDVPRRYDHSPFNARIDRHLAAVSGASGPVLPAARTDKHCGMVAASVSWPTNQPPPPPPTSSSPSHPPRPPPVASSDTETFRRHPEV